MRNSKTHSVTMKKKLTKCQTVFNAYNDLQYAYGTTIPTIISKTFKNSLKSSDNCISVPFTLAGTEVPVCILSTTPRLYVTPAVINFKRKIVT